VSRLTKRYLPFHWKDAPSVAFTQGQAKTFKATEIGLFDPERRVKTMVLASGSLPSGVRIVGTTVQYDGAGSAASSSFALTVGDGTYTYTSPSGTATVETTQTNTPPQWTVPDGYSLGTFTTTAGGTFDLTSVATDAEGDPMVFARTGGTAPGSVTVSESGVLTVPAGLTASTYTVTVDLTEATGTAEQDWLARSTAPGVVWAHDFRNAAEFTNFHELEAAYVAPTYTVLDSSKLGGLESAIGSQGISTMSRVAITLPDGSAGYAVQASIPYGFTGYPGATANEFGATGGSAPIWFSNGTTTTWSGEKIKMETRASSGRWWRPLAGLSSGNGLGAADIGVQRGTVTGRTWNTASRYQPGNWLTGYYGHADYWGTSGSAPSDWDGSEFWLQFRVRFSADRFAHFDGSTCPDYTTGRVFPGRVYAPSGKLAWIYDSKNNDAEFIFVSGYGYKQENWGDSGPFEMYTDRGGHALQYPENSGSTQPGGDYAACNISSNRAACWTWPVDEWVTVLLWIRPGHQRDSNYQPRDTYVKVWAAREGETSYTRIFNPPDGTFWFWQDPAYGTPLGQFSLFKFDGYMNNIPSIAAFTQQITQVIFKKGAGTTLTPNPETDGIPCPQI
jgi:hypothetical protein